MIFPSFPDTPLNVQNVFSPELVLRSILALCPSFFLASRCQRIVIHLAWSCQNQEKKQHLVNHLYTPRRSSKFNISYPLKREKSEKERLVFQNIKGSKRHDLHSKHGSVDKKHLTPLKTNMTMEKHPWVKMYLPLKNGWLFHCHLGSNHGSGVFRSISTSKWMVGILLSFWVSAYFQGQTCCYRGSSRREKLHLDGKPTCRPWT